MKRASQFLDTMSLSTSSRLPTREPRSRSHSGIIFMVEFLIVLKFEIWCLPEQTPDTPKSKASKT